MEKVLKNIFKSIFQNEYTYDHRSCTIKQYGIHPSNSIRIYFQGKTVHLDPGNYQISCKTPYGYKIKHIKLKEEKRINIKELFVRQV